MLCSSGGLGVVDERLGVEIEWHWRGMVREFVEACGFKLVLLR
jgi:hypothetical protein